MVMKRSEAILSLSEKLQKSQNLLDGYKKGSITLKCLCDNLATRAVDYCENELKMSPPFNDWLYHMDGDRADSENIRYLIWESEDDLP
jgi:hypothetical protein